MRPRHLAPRIAMFLAWILTGTALAEPAGRPAFVGVVEDDQDHHPHRTVRPPARMLS